MKRSGSGSKGRCGSGRRRGGVPLRGREKFRDVKYFLYFFFHTQKSDEAFPELFSRQLGEKGAKGYPPLCLTGPTSFLLKEGGC